MTATPALTNDIFGVYQKKISDALYLDHKDSEYILTELETFALELSSIMSVRDCMYVQYPEHFTTNTDPGDEHAKA